MEKDPDTGRRVKRKVQEYEYEAEMEAAYRYMYIYIYAHWKLALWRFYQALPALDVLACHTLVHWIVFSPEVGG